MEYDGAMTGEGLRQVTRDWIKMWERAKMAEQGYRAWLNSSPGVIAGGYAVDPAKPGSDRTVELSLPPKAVEPKSSVDHTWDMLVLAARSSRYGE